MNPETSMNRKTAGLVGTSACVALLSLLPGAACAGTIMISAGPLKDRLANFFGTTPGANEWNVLWDPRMEGLCSKPVRAESDWVQALTRMLAGTGFVIVFLDHYRISLKRAGAAEASAYCEPMSELVVSPPRQARRIKRAPALTPDRQTMLHMDGCTCAYTIESSGEVTRGPWCKHEDGRSQYMPERCPSP